MFRLLFVGDRRALRETAEIWRVFLCFRRMGTIELLAGTGYRDIPGRPRRPLTIHEEASLKLLKADPVFTLVEPYQTISTTPTGRTHYKPHHGGSLHGCRIRQPHRAKGI